MTSVKLSILKGGPSSGNFDHAGRPGKVGGSAPGKGKGKGVKKKVAGKPSIFIDSYDEVKSTKYGKGYFITGDDRLVDIAADFGGGTNDHVGAFVAMEHPEAVGLTKADAKKFEEVYEAIDSRIMDYWEKIHQSGVIRVREFGKKVYIDTYDVDRKTLRRIQGLMDEGKIRFYPGKENVWAASGAWWNEVRFTYADMIDANNVDIDGAKLKEDTKMTKVKVTLKGSPSSGNFGHAGRPGKVGGSAPGKGKGNGKAKPKPKAAISSFEQQAKSGGYTYERDLDQGLQAKTTLVKMEDGTLAVKKVYEWGDDNVNLARNDAAIYNIAEALGMDNVPKTVEVSDGVSVQEFIGDSTTLTDFLMDYHEGSELDPRQLESMLYFDVLTGNGDRHTNNVLVNKDTNKLSLIDSNWSLIASWSGNTAEIVAGEQFSSYNISLESAITKSGWQSFYSKASNPKIKNILVDAYGSTEGQEMYDNAMERLNVFAEFYAP